MIRTTFAASPRRGRVLAAKALVIGSVTFVAGLIGGAVALLIAEHKLHSGGWVTSVFPVWSLTSGHGLQMVVGTAGLFAVAAILALSAGAMLRRSAGAITAVVVVLIVPLILGTLLPQGPADWLLRLTPAAAFGLQQGTPQYSQVMHTCLPYNGCYPLSPWNGFAVLRLGPGRARRRHLRAAPEGRMSALREAVHAEWTKLRTVPSTAWLLATAIVLTVGVSTLRPR